MCGIAGVYLRDPSIPVNMDAILDTLLSEIENRGRHATGFVALHDDGAEWQKASCSATEFIRHRRWVPKNTRTLLAHTRYATQGLAAFIENNHPIKRGPFYIIHNGHVTNDSELFRKSERSRFGRVDSEAIAARLAWYAQLSALGDVMAEIEGAAAVAAADERDPSRLVVARGRSSPLYIYNGQKIVIFASTRDAIIKAHGRHVGTIAVSRLKELKEGEMVEWVDEEDAVFSEFEVIRPKVWTPTPSSYDPRRYTGWASGASEYERYEDREYTGFALPPRQLAITSGSDDDGDEDESETEADKVWHRHPERNWSIADEIMTCDNCSDYTYEEDIEYRKDDDEGVIWMLCPDCTVLYDGGEIGQPLSEEEAEATRFSFMTELDQEEDEDDWDIDDYEGANKSILNSFKRRILGMD